MLCLHVWMGTESKSLVQAASCTYQRSACSFCDIIKGIAYKKLKDWLVSFLGSWPTPRLKTSVWLILLDTAPLVIVKEGKTYHEASERVLANVGTTRCLPVRRSGPARDPILTNCPIISSSQSVNSEEREKSVGVLKLPATPSTQPHILHPRLQPAISLVKAAMGLRPHPPRWPPRCHSIPGISALHFFFFFFLKKEKTLNNAFCCSCSLLLSSFLLTSTAVYSAAAGPTHQNSLRGYAVIIWWRTWNYPLRVHCIT